MHHQLVNLIEKHWAKYYFSYLFFAPLIEDRSCPELQSVFSLGLNAQKFCAHGLQGQDGDHFLRSQDDVAFAKKGIP